jgi:phage replication initiation protein
VAKENVLPPTSDTGAGNTEKKELRALVDWVRVTFFDLKPMHIIGWILGMKGEDFELINRGRYRYRKTLRCGNINIYFEGVDEEAMGCCLDISGQGCRQVEASAAFRGWEEFFKDCLGYRCNFPRVDVALDDFKGYFRMEQVNRKVDKKEVLSKFRKVSDQGERSLKPGEDSQTKTIRFGSRTSQIMIRFYDKLAEQKNKKKEIDEDIKFWNRVEIEAKDDRAFAIAVLISKGESLGEMVQGILKNYIRFVVPGKDSNRSRWKTWRPWERFLNGVKRIKLSVAPEEKSLEESIEWLEKQVAKTLLKVVMAESIEFIQELVVNDKNQYKLKPRDYRQIETYRKNKEKARLLAQDAAQAIN